MEILYISLEQNINFIPLVLGIYLSYRILNITDLTVDGTFVLGAGLYARLLEAGISACSTVLLTIACGFVAGLFVALIQLKNRINSLIASILALFILYSVNFQIMGRANISLQDQNTLIDLYGEYINVLGGGFAILFVAFILSTQLGIKLRGFGSNRTLIQKIVPNAEILKFLGLGFSNMLAALSGILTAQVSGYADINMGFGMALTGIGAVVIGQEIIRRCYHTSNTFSISSDLLGCCLGGLIYFLSLNVLLLLGVEPINLKLVMGVALIILLRGASYSGLKSYGRQYV